MDFPFWVNLSHTCHTSLALKGRVLICTNTNYNSPYICKNLYLYISDKDVLRSRHTLLTTVYSVWWLKALAPDYRLRRYHLKPSTSPTISPTHSRPLSWHLKNYLMYLSIKSHRQRHMFKYSHQLNWWRSGADVGWSESLVKRDIQTDNGDVRIHPHKNLNTYKRSTPYIFKFEMPFCVFSHTHSLSLSLLHSAW